LGSSHNLEKMQCMGCEQSCGRKDAPRDELWNRQRFMKPPAGVPHDEQNQKLECKEAEEPISLPGAPSVDRCGDSHSREHDKQ
jgi:hypothetical protein